MKFFLLVLVLSFGFKIEAKSILQNQYIIASDLLDTSVPEGKCLVTGKSTYQMSPLKGSLISTLNGLSKAYTDSSGNYSFLLDIADTAIFYFHKNYEELVLWQYSFQNQHHVVIDFYAGFNIIYDQVDKPVLYLYSESELSVSLKVNFRGDFTFSYPQLEKNEWQVTVNKKGITTPKGDIEYPYLFWEGEMNGLTFKKEGDIIVGEVVEKDKVVLFLEAKLTEAGFNSREKTDFITFWAPKMINHDYLLIQFLEDADYASKIADLTVIPKPDNAKRLYMLYSGFEQYPIGIQCSPQSLVPVNRTGFTLIDWGGTALKIESIQL
jgi:hypothetical protein